MKLNPVKCIVSIALFVISATAAVAGSNRDVDELVALLKKAGTSVAALTNKETDGYCSGKHGFYVVDPKAKPPIDLLVICKDQVDIKDRTKVWDVLAHESTHVMQACIGHEDGKIFKPEFSPTMLRELKKFAPHYYAIVSENYGSNDAGPEIEAFWMELQHPSDVIDNFKHSCEAYFKKGSGNSQSSKRASKRS